MQHAHGFCCGGGDIVTIRFNFWKHITQEATSAAVKCDSEYQAISGKTKQKQKDPTEIIPLFSENMRLKSFCAALLNMACFSSFVVAVSCASLVLVRFDTPPDL